MINWTEGVDYYLNCTTWEDIFISLADYQSRPDLIGAFGGITISGDRLQAGFKFSQPTMSTGMPLLYRYVPNNIFYLRSIAREYLGLFLALPVFLGLVLYIFENRRMSVLNYIYHAATVFVRRNDDRFLSTIAQITGIGLKLLLLMTLYRYIATTTNNLSSDKTRRCF